MLFKSEVYSDYKTDEVLCCADELNLDRKHRRMLDKTIVEMQDIVNRTEPSDMNESPILNGIEVWHNAYPALLNKYRDRLVDSMNQQKQMVESVKTAIERPTNYYNYEAGATHDDKRHQLLLSEDREKTLRQKANRTNRI